MGVKMGSRSLVTPVGKRGFSVRVLVGTLNDNPCMENKLYQSDIHPEWEPGVEATGRPSVVSHAMG